MSCGWIGFCSLDPQAQAAWVQAIFSVIAILVAGWLPFLHSRVKEKRGLVALYAAAIEVAHGAGDIVAGMGYAIDEGKAVSHKYLYRWAALVDEWTEIRLGAMPTHAVIPAVLRIKSSSRLLGDVVKSYNERLGQGLVATRDPGLVDEYVESERLMGLINDAVLAVERIERDFQVWSPLGFASKGIKWMAQSLGLRRVP